MSNIKGWFQGLKQKNKDEEANGEENTTSTVATAEEQVTLGNSSQKNNMNEDLPESDQNTTLEKMVTEELNLDDEDKKDDTVVTTHVSSASDQFLNMTAIALDSVPGLEPKTFANETQAVDDTDREVNGITDDPREKMDEIEATDENIAAKENIAPKEGLPDQTQNGDRPTYTSEPEVKIDGKTERKLLMGEMLKVSLDQPNYNAKHVVCG